MEKEEFIERLNQAKEMFEMQSNNGNYNFDEYMLGLYNGMECIIAILENRVPQYRDGHKIEFLKDKTIKGDNLENKE